MDDLIGILALESRRHRCLVVGEDLGTVPEGFRERMEAAGILSYRVLFFEVDAEGAFVQPQDYPPLALATPGSHDLATLRGWWEANDIELKSRHGLYPGADEKQHQHEQRAKERVALLHALEVAGLGLSDLDATGPFRSELADAVHAFLARTRAGLAMFASNASLSLNSSRWTLWARSSARISSLPFSIPASSRAAMTSGLVFGSGNALVMSVSM